jgi:hypothetical protein
MNYALKMPFSIILTHLGDSIPFYIKDCVHQIRLWNSSEVADIYIILDQEEGPFWNDLETSYAVKIVYARNLKKTIGHLYFRKEHSCDMNFRSGYWCHVKERFFYIEELMNERGLVDVISMEYDVMLYMKLSELVPKLKEYVGDRLSMVMDHESRGHPGFMYLANASVINKFNKLMCSLVKSDRGDMQLLAFYSAKYPESVAFLPAIPPTDTQRKSIIGFTSEDPSHLWKGFDKLGVLFDSAVVGQWLAGVDPRNTKSVVTIKYENLEALYSVKEFGFKWERSGTLWRPVFAGAPLATIHMHSKALYCFLSDRTDTPCGDYNMETLYKSLLQN